MKNRSEVKNKQSRSNPQMLVLLLLAAGGFSTIMQFFVPYASNMLISWTPGAMVLTSFFMHLFSFPFWMTCVVWLAARSGRTDWSTWIVPLALTAAPNLMVFSGVFAIATILPNVSYMSIGEMIFFQWMSFRSNLLTYVLLAILFRATTLHLRPVGVAALPNRLTILTVLLLTTAVAVVLSIELLAHQRVSTHEKSIYPQSSYQFIILFVLSDLMSTALIWFSVAWLFVARNPKQWIGGVGLIVYLMSFGLYTLDIIPLFLDREPLPPGVTMQVMGPFDFAGMLPSKFFMFC